MIDALTTGGLVATSPQSTASLPPPGSADVERFRTAMMPPTEQLLAQGPTATAGTTITDAAATQSPSSPAATIGDTILGTLQDLSADTRQRYAQIGEVLSKPDLSMSDLMSLQFTLLQTSLQFEIASKGISKLAQNIDSVLKTQ